jgi:hypothetical protein
MAELIFGIGLCIGIAMIIYLRDHRDRDDGFQIDTSHYVNKALNNRTKVFDIPGKQHSYNVSSRLREKKHISKILSGHTFFISQFEGGWDDKWPDPIIIFLSKGKMRAIDDLFYYNSKNEKPREIRGGSTNVKITVDGSVEGPIDGYDDGEMTGRILRAAGYENFWFYEIDFSQIDKTIDEWQYIILDYDNISGESSDIITLKSFNINVVRMPPLSMKNDYFEFLSEMVPQINDTENCLLSDYIPFENTSNCLFVGRFIRVNSTDWKYEPKWENINLKDYLSVLNIWSDV